MHKVSGLLDGSHERGDLLRLLGEELLVRDDDCGSQSVKKNQVMGQGNVRRTNRAEAATSQFGENVDTEHSNVGSRSALFFAIFLELNALNVLQSDSSIDRTVDNSTANVHTNSNGCVIGWDHSVPFREFVDLSFVVASVR